MDLKDDSQFETQVLTVLIKNGYATKNETINKES